MFFSSVKNPVKRFFLNVALIVLYSRMTVLTGIFTVVVVFCVLFGILFAVIFGI